MNRLRARAGQGVLVYQVRAVTAGHFTLPPTTAEAMYDPEITTRTAPTQVRITDPWGGS